MKTILLFALLLCSIMLSAQSLIDTTTYDLTLNNDRTVRVKFLEFQEKQYIKVIDEFHQQYTYSWGAIKFYKPAYAPAKKEVVQDQRFDPNFNHTGYVPKLPGQRQRNVGIGLFALGTGLLAAAIPMLATADQYYYRVNYYSNGQSTREGDLKGGLGVVLVIPAVALTITGAALWGKGAGKMRRYKAKNAN